MRIIIAILVMVVAAGPVGGLRLPADVGEDPGDGLRIGEERDEGEGGATGGADQREDLVDGETLLSGLLARSEAPSLAHFVRSLVGLDRAAAQPAFSAFLNDRSLTPPQIRFVEMVIDQLTARGVMDASALYEPPFSSLHAEGPDALFDGKENVIEGIFETLEAVRAGLCRSSRPPGVRRSGPVDPGTTILMDSRPRLPKIYRKTLEMPIPFREPLRLPVL